MLNPGGPALSMPTEQNPFPADVPLALTTTSMLLKTVAVAVEVK